MVYHMIQYNGFWFFKGVFGGLDIHGRPQMVTWTRIMSSALAGSRMLHLEEHVDWRKGDTIVIAPTQYNTWQTEVNTIASIDGDIAMLETPLQFHHKGKHLNPFAHMLRHVHFLHHW